MHISRRDTLQALLGAGLFAALGKPAWATAFPDTIPGGTEVRIADPERQLALQLSGIGKDLPYATQWANIAGGPAILQAFRANALDVGTIGGIPPLLAHSTGLDVKIIAVRYRTVPAYTLATAPGTAIKELGDLKGKKIGFSAGQEQGLFVLQVLKQAGLDKKDVTLTRLTSAEFQNALASRQIDAAPITEPQLTNYLRQFGRDGASALRPDITATPTTLTATAAVLADPAKAAALRDLVKRWYQASIWADQNREEWIASYYVKSQKVSDEAGRRILDGLGKPLFDTSWAEARSIVAEANDFLVSEGIVKKIPVESLFDSRFEPLAGEVADAQYLPKRG